MKYQDKTEEQLKNGSPELRKRIEDWEAGESRHKRAGFVSNVYLVDHKRNIFTLDNNK